MNFGNPRVKIFCFLNSLLYYYFHMPLGGMLFMNKAFPLYKFPFTVILLSLYLHTKVIKRLLHYCRI